MRWMLCGPPAVGKSLVARLVAKRLSWIFVDTDELIESAYMQEVGVYRTFREVYQLEGEKGFRRRETEALEGLHGYDSAVIALGGGVVDKEKVHPLGSVIYLKASFECLWKRMCLRQLWPCYLKGDVPKEKLFHRVEGRVEAYSSLAHYVIETDPLSAQETADRVEEIICYGIK